jgi:hypothetical protein
MSRSFEHGVQTQKVLQREKVKERERLERLISTILLYRVLTFLVVHRTYTY